MTWLDWIIIASIAALAGALIGTRRRWARLYLNVLHSRNRDGASQTSATSGPTDEPRGTTAQRYPEEDITAGITGVKTRTTLTEALDAEWRRSFNTGGQFCLVIVDLDRLRQVNDRLGRAEGDLVLAAVGSLLAARCRHSSQVARYGGDEFAMLMPASNTLQAEILAERLRAALEAETVLCSREVTVSVGIAGFPDHGGSPGEIMRMADAALRLAKRCGGNCVKVASLLSVRDDAEHNRRMLETCLEAAGKRTRSQAAETTSGGSPSRPELWAARAGEESGPQDEERPPLVPTNDLTAKPLAETIAALAFAIEARGRYRQDHSRAVSRLAAQLALRAGLSEAEVEQIRLAGLAHDIGKIHVPDYVLHKPTLLTAQEFEVIKSHAAWGAKILEYLNVKTIERAVLHHHERYDGKGYPAGLEGETIPLAARILAVAESFHVMVSDLRYKSARTFDEALDELRRCSGTQFDPGLVSTFLAWIQSPTSG